ncbi:MAG TPA: TlpA disulfide reductase family protein [Opitutaceae bacterium]
MLAFCAFAVFSILLKNDLRREKSPLDSLPLGHPMPDFSLAGADGGEYTLSRIVPAKKLVMINFWASWCQPCRMEMPEFESLYHADSQKGLIILAVNEDQDPAKFAAYIKERPITFPVLLDRGGKLAEKLGIRAFPTTILVPADGRVTAVVEGLDQYMKFRVDAALNAKPVRGKAGQPPAAGAVTEEKGRQ